MGNYRLTRQDFLDVVDAHSSSFTMEKRTITAKCHLRDDFEYLSFALDHWSVEYSVKVTPNREGGIEYIFTFALPIFKHCKKYGIDRKF